MIESIETINTVGLSVKALDQTFPWLDGTGSDATMSVREVLEEEALVECIDFTHKTEIGRVNLVVAKENADQCRSFLQTKIPEIWDNLDDAWEY